MSRLFVSYKPTLDTASWDDPYFNRDEAEDERMPDAEEWARMLHLARSFMALPHIGGPDYYTLQDREDKPVQAIQLAYTSVNGALEIRICHDTIRYDISHQYGGELFYVINQLTLMARHTGGYFAYVADDGGPPYDPLVAEDNVLPGYEIMANGPANYVPGQVLPYHWAAATERKKWWQFWKKQASLPRVRDTKGPPQAGCAAQRSTAAKRTPQ